MICLIYFALVTYISNAWQRPYLDRDDENHYPSWCDRIVSSINGPNAAEYAILESGIRGAEETYPVYGSIGAEDITDIAKTDHDGVWRKLTIRHTPIGASRARRGVARHHDLKVYVVSINVEENTVNGVTSRDSMDDYIWENTSDPPAIRGERRVPNRDVIFVSIQEAALVADTVRSVRTALLRTLLNGDGLGYQWVGSKSSSHPPGTNRKIMAFIFFRQVRDENDVLVPLPGLTHGGAHPRRWPVADAGWTVHYLNTFRTKGFVVSPALIFHGIRVQFAAAHFPFTGKADYNARRRDRAAALVWWDTLVRATPFDGVSILAGDLNFRSRPEPADPDGNPTEAELTAYTGPAFVFGGVADAARAALVAGQGGARVPFAAATDTYTYDAANDELRWSIIKLRAAYPAAHDGDATPARYLTFDEADITFNPTCKLKKWTDRHRAKDLSDDEKRALTAANLAKNDRRLRGTISLEPAPLTAAHRGYNNMYLAAKREYNNEYEEYNDYKSNNMYEAWNRYRELVEEYKMDLSLEHKREKTAERLLKHQRQNVLRARQKVIDY